MTWLAFFRRGPDRKQVEREADKLLTFLGDMAYDEARTRARASRDKGDRASAKLWSKVAVTIARRTGHQIGSEGADCYEPSRKPDVASELARNMQAINRAMLSIAKGQHAETELHNVQVFVLRALDLVNASPAAQAAGNEVCRAAVAFVGAKEAVQASIEQGLYPAQLEPAGQAIERFRKAVLASPRRR